MVANEISSKVNWYGTAHLVRIWWEMEAEELVSVKCYVDGKEIVKLFRRRWTDRKGKRYDSQSFMILERCCKDNFKDAKNMIPAFSPIFSIIHGEDM